MDEQKLEAPNVVSNSLLERTKPCDEPCPKCGSLDVWREFWKKGTCKDAKKWNTVEGKYESVDGSRRWATRDHITHHCRCCQCDWKGLPLSMSRKSSKAELSRVPDRGET